MFSWDDTSLNLPFIFIDILSFIISILITFILGEDKKSKNNNEIELQNLDNNNGKNEEKEKEKEKNLIDNKENKKMNLKRNDNNDEDNNSSIFIIDVEIRFSLTFFGWILITIYSFQG